MLSFVYKRIFFERGSGGKDPTFLQFKNIKIHSKIKYIVHLLKIILRCLCRIIILRYVLMPRPKIKPYFAGTESD